MHRPIGELIDASAIQRTLEQFCEPLGLEAAILDAHGRVVTGFEWRRSCTRYAEAHREACWACFETLVQGASAAVTACQGGLYAVVAPIDAGPRRLGTILCGPFHLENPDFDAIRATAESHGLDADRCVEAAMGARVLGTQQVESIAGFLESFAGMLATMCSERARSLRRQAALGESEAMLRALCDNALDAIVMIDGNGHAILWNPAAERIFGWKAEEMLGRSVHDILVPTEERQQYAEAFPRFLETGQGAVVNRPTELYAVRKDGGRVPIEITVAPVQAGNQMHAIAVVRDITERKRGQQIERLNQMRIEGLLRLNHMADASVRELTTHAMEEVVRLTGSKIGYIAFMNESETVLTMYAWSKDALEQCAVSDRPFEYAVANTGLWGEAVRQRRCVITNDYDAPNIWKRGTPEGHVRLTRHMNLPVFDDGKIVLVAGVGNKAEDYNDSDAQQLRLLMEGMWRIVRKRRAEQEREQAWGLLEAAVSNSPLGIVIVDATSSKLLLVNAAARRLHGIPDNGPVTEAAFRAAVAARLRRADGTPFEFEDMPLMRAIFTEQITRSDELLLIDPEGQRRWLLASAAPVRASDGHVSAGVLLLQDVTDQRVAAEERSRLTEQFHQSQKMESIGRLAGGLAHDFNNLLTVINGYSQMLADRQAPGSFEHEALSAIVRAGDKGANLIRQLLMFSRKQAVEPRMVDLNHLIRDLEKILVRLLGEDIELVTELHPNIGHLMADPHQLEQVVVNLAVNARDAMPRGGRLTIRTDRIQSEGACPFCGESLEPGPYTRLSIQDTGVGMDENTRQRLFEPFFTTKEVGKGTGLGLSIVHGVVSQCKGHIDVASAPGEGAVFHLHFPETEEIEQEAHRDVCSAETGGGETVLVVEDQAAVLRFTVEALRRHGFHVLEAADAEHALAICEDSSQTVDLLLTDVVMPNMSGPDLLMRARARLPGLKALYMSGYSDERIARPGIEAKVIAKPFAASQLVREVRKALGPMRSDGRSGDSGAPGV